MEYWASRLKTQSSTAISIFEITHGGYQEEYYPIGDCLVLVSETLALKEAIETAFK